MNRTLTIVPRWAGHAASDFYPWLQHERPAGFGTVRALNMPAPQQPAPGTWVPALAEALAPRPSPDTVLMGHSVGCQTVLRYLATLPEGPPLEGVVLVAAWWSVDSPWETLRPWLEPALSLDWARVRTTARRFVVLLSDNDPFTSDFRENGRLWTERLGAEVVLVPGARHFNGAQEPAVRETLERYFPALP